MRGPGWMFFHPFQTWDHTRVLFEVNVDLHEKFGIASTWGKFIFGGGVVTGFVVVCGGLFHVLFKKYKPLIYDRMNLYQYLTLQFFFITMMSLPVKILLRHAFTIKYVWVTPWFNI